MDKLVFFVLNDPKDHVAVQDLVMKVSIEIISFSRDRQQELYTPSIDVAMDYYASSSSVDWSARGQRNFRFALRCPDGAISGQKRVFLGGFWGFLAPRQAGRPGEPRSDQSEAEFGAGLAFTYTHNREMGGGPLLVKKGGFSAPKQAGRPGEGRKTKRAAPQSCL